MWALVVIVWTLNNGQLEERMFMANQQFNTQIQCVEAGRREAPRLAGRIDDVVGAGFMCANQNQPPPSSPQRGEYEA